MQDEKKLKIQIALGNIIKQHRKISISQIANEIDLSKSVWSEIEKGNRDVQLSTFWRVAEALNIAPSKLLKEIEKELGEDFSFIEN